MCFYNTKQDLQQMWHILWSQPWDGINCSILDISSNELHPTFSDPLLHTWHSAQHKENKVNKTWSLPSRLIAEGRHWADEYSKWLSVGPQRKSGQFSLLEQERGRSLMKGFKEEVWLELSLKRLVGGQENNAGEWHTREGKSLKKFMAWHTLGTASFSNVVWVGCNGGRTFREMALEK